jgi:hypothetical protein
MSVDKRRFAAAQRTAARRTTPSRKRRLGAWIIILPALTLFSFSVVAGAAGARGKPDVAGAAAKVIPQSHGDDHGAPPGGGDQGSDQSKGQNKDDGTLVVVDSSHDEAGMGELLGKGGREICWISKSQLARVSTVYRTTTSTLKVGHTTYRLVTVYGANEKTLKQLLGTSAVQCRLVHVAHLFFLPFDPNLS